jgi:predicted negative regulator of RcsB-dependent stress response
MVRLGDVHCDAGDTDAARAVWEQALAALTELDDPDADALRRRLRSLVHEPSSPTVSA